MANIYRPFDTVPSDILSCIFWYIPYKKANWINILITCKRFLTIGRKVFDPRVKDNSAIHHACKNGYTNLLCDLLKDSRIDPNCYFKGDVYQTQPLDLAIDCNEPEIVRLLLADPRLKLECNKMGVHPINRAANVGRLEITKMLLADTRLDPNMDLTKLCIDVYDTHSYYDVALELLKDHRVDPSVNNSSFFIHACHNGPLEIVRALLSDKRVDCCTFVCEGLVKACESGRTDIISELLKEPRIDPTVCQEKCLSAAVRYNRPWTMAVLLHDPRIDPTIKDNWIIREVEQYRLRYDYRVIYKLLMEHPKVSSTYKKGSLQFGYGLGLI